MYYTVLKRTSETNGEEIIYESDKMMGGDWYGICILLSFAAVGIGMFGWMAVVVYKCVKAMDGKPFNGTRTYSTAYSVDDCMTYSGIPSGRIRKTRRCLRLRNMSDTPVRR